MNRVESPAWDEYLLGGYFLCETYPAGNAAEASDSSGAVVSVSGCLCQTIPDSWAFRWADCEESDRVVQAGRFGLSQNALRRLMDWVEEHFGRDLGWPDVFFSREAAKAFADEFLSDKKRAMLLGIGLPVSLAAGFLEETAPRKTDMVSGICTLIEQGRLLSREGEIMGYEVLGLETDLMHSWMCHSEFGMETVERLGISVGAHGLLTSESDAAAVARAYNEGPGTEPVWWAPWLLARYEW